MSVTIRVRVDAGGPQVEIDEDVDVYVHMESADEDVADQQLQIRFTDEGLIIDAFEEGNFIGTSSETYDEISDRLRESE